MPTTEPLARALPENQTPINSCLGGRHCPCTSDAGCPTKSPLPPPAIELVAQVTSLEWLPISPFVLKAAHSSVPREPSLGHSYSYIWLHRTFRSQFRSLSQTGPCPPARGPVSLPVGDHCPPSSAVLSVCLSHAAILGSCGGPVSQEDRAQSSAPGSWGKDLGVLRSGSQGSRSACWEEYSKEQRGREQGQGGGQDTQVLAQPRHRQPSPLGAPSLLSLTPSHSLPVAAVSRGTVNSHSPGSGLSY